MIRMILADADEYRVHGELQAGWHGRVPEWGPGDIDRLQRKLERLQSNVATAQITRGEF